MALPSLTNALTFFEQAFDQGRTALGPSALSLFQALVILELIFAGMYMALGDNGDLRAIARKILFVGFLLWIIQNYAAVLHSIVDGFLQAGAQAASVQGLNFATLQDPDRIFLRGLEIAKPAVEKLFAQWSTSFMGIPSIDMIFLAFTIIVSILSYGLMAIQVFITYLEFLLVTMAGFILIPFGAFKPTAFLAERTFGAILAFGIKLLVLALVIGVSDRFLVTISLPSEVTWQQAFEFVIISMALAFLTIHAPAAALSLFGGSPHFSFTTVAATAAGAGFALRQTAHNSTRLISGAAQSTAAAAGALAGGGVAAASKVRSSTSEDAGSRLVTRSAKATAAVAGAPAGIVAGIASETGEKLFFGKRGSPTGRKALASQLPDVHTAGGIVGAYNSGKLSVPQYRRHLEQSLRSSSQPAPTNGIAQSDRTANASPTETSAGRS